MDDTPEIMKLLKYILFALLFSHVGQALVTEPPQIIPAPFYQSDEVRSDLISSLSENREPFRPRPLPHIQSKRDDLDPDAERNSGGHKGTRQTHSPPPQEFQRPQSSPSGPSPSPPGGRYAGDGFESLCSIFRTFLEPRRFRRCHVSNGQPQQMPHPDVGYFDREGPSGPSGPLPSNDLNPETSQGGGQHSQQQHHQRRNNIGEMLMDDQDRERNLGASQDQLGGPQSIPSQSIANKRYDHIEDIQINHSGEDDADEQHHLIQQHQGPPPSHQQDPTKISQDRTMIVVPERGCPQGQRRDPRGYCRRLVKIRTSYQYGPPPPNVVRPIPIRYYYSRIVAFPALHFFFPNV